ncbi:MAG: hypothetical protein Q4P17_03985 [Methanobacterium sp.]|nr:hypothetical protein [Methanobacterium sp.]
MDSLRKKKKLISDSDFRYHYLICKSDELLGKKVSNDEIINEMGISRATFYRKKKRLCSEEGLINEFDGNSEIKDET